MKGETLSNLIIYGMPNWCYTSYLFMGDRKEIKELHGLMKRLGKRKKPLVNSDFGSTWLGCLVEALDRKWQDVRCRGYWENLEISGNELRFDTVTAWCAAYEVIGLICEKYPSLNHYYYSEEPGMCIYETNDDTGLYYPDKYFVDMCTPDNTNMSEYFISIGAALDWVGRMVGQTFKYPEDVKVFFDEAEKENGDCYCYIHEIHLVDK